MERWTKHVTEFKLGSVLESNHMKDEEGDERGR
jgi:hypothetical protein